MPITVLATRDGRLDAADLWALSQLKRRLERGGADVLLHLHGGLVDEAAGRAIAARLAGMPPSGFGLAPAYEQIFVVWRTGALETIGANWTELFETDRLYKILLRRVIAFVGRKLGVPSGRGVAVMAELTPAAIDEALALQPAGNPFPQADGAILEGRAGGRGPTVSAQSDMDLEEEFRLELEVDDVFKAVGADVAAALSADEPSGRAGGATAADRTAGEGILARLTGEVRSDLYTLSRAAKIGRGVLTAAGVITFLATHGAAIAVRVIRRIRSKRDHGFYGTIVEELVRELYGDFIGATIWGMIKKDASDPFTADGAGPLLIEALTAGASARLSITAHSAGSIWAASLITALAGSAAPPRIDLAMLAPAVRIDAFAEALEAGGALIDRFRMFTMCDALERQDAVLGHNKGYLYPSSLLYLVSGLFEERNNEAFADAPLLGMQRFHTPDPSWLGDADESAAVRKLLAFLAAPKRDVVYARTDGGPGLSSSSDTHGGFDSEAITLASVSTFLS